MTAQVDKTLSISEAARFFEKSIAWMRWIEAQPGLLVREDGTPIEIERRMSRRGMAAGQRRYTHEDIRDMAAALFRAGKINNAEFQAVTARAEAFI